MVWSQNKTAQTFYSIELEIPSNRKIFEDFIKDYAIEDKVRAQHVERPNPLVNRKGSITTISIPPQKSDDTLTTDEDIDCWRWAAVE